MTSPVLLAPSISLSSRYQWVQKRPYTPPTWYPSNLDQKSIPKEEVPRRYAEIHSLGARLGPKAR